MCSSDLICHEMARMTGRHVYNQIIHNPQGLALEQILFNEARLSPQIDKLGLRQRKKQIEPLISLCRVFNRHDPEINAELLFGSITSMEYHALTLHRDEVDEAQIVALLRRLLGWLSGLKSA